MEKQKKMNITFESSLDNIIEVNPSFDKGILKIAYTGLNRNNSFISKETFEKEINTMFLCPVVANYSTDNNQIGSHDIALKENTNGDMEMINLTQPVGVIPQSANWYWQNIEDNGIVHEYLCTEAILWKRQPCYQKIKKDGITSESMEIDVINGKMVNGYYQIDDFCFTAFCLLGNAEPCFESASLQLFNKQDFKEQYTQMMKEFKKAFFNTNFSIKDGEQVLNTKETEIKDFQVGDKLGTGDSIKIDNSKKSAVNSKTWRKPDVSFLNKLLESSNHEALVNEAYAQVSGDASGDLSVNDVGYPHHDIKDGALVVDVAGVEAAYKRAKQQGVTGDTMDHIERHRKELGLDKQDNSLIKNDKKVEKMEDTKAKDTIDFKVEYEKIKGDYAKIQTEFEKYKKNYVTPEKDVAELRTYKADKIASERQANIDAIFAKSDFESIKDNKEFNDFKANVGNMSLEDIENRCYTILGKTTAKEKANFSINKPENKPSVVVKVDTTPAPEDPYGGLFSEFGNKN